MREGTINDPLARWYDYVESHDPAALDALIADDAVFKSPAVFRPLEGKAVTGKYLTAAMQLPGNDSFRYAGEWRADGSDVLAFACTVDGMEVEGVDMIWCSIRCSRSPRPSRPGSTGRNWRRWTRIASSWRRERATAR